MRIITWNCQGAFRRKAERIAPGAPDIAVIQECERPERLKFPPHVAEPATVLWFGERDAKGLGIFSYTGLRFTVDDAYDPTIRYCIPLHVHGLTQPLKLLAVWAMAHPDPKLSYVGQIVQALPRYQRFLSQGETLAVGDFNSNACWDKRPRIGNHTWVVTTLAQHGLTSLYHEQTGEAHGEESRMTWFMHRKQKFAYHIDYCFAPRAWLPRVRRFDVGEFEEWIPHSDHMPLLAEFAR